MRTWYILILCLCFSAMLGCNTTPYGGQTPAERREANAAITTGYFEDAVRNGVIEQHTLFAYHFADSAAELTPLGERDLAILAEYYKENGGPLSVRRDGASESLYRSRVEQVVAFLQGHGVDPLSITIADEPPGGSGATGDRVVQIMKEDNERRQKAKPSSNSVGGGR